MKESMQRGVQEEVLAAPLAQSGVQGEEASHRSRRRVAEPTTDVDLLADDHAAWPSLAAHGTQRCRWPREVRQYQAAIHQVERALRLPGRVGISHLKFDVPQVPAPRLQARLLDLVRRDVDGRDRPTRRNLLSHPAGNIAPAATDLEALRRRQEALPAGGLRRDLVVAAFDSLIEDGEPIDGLVGVVVGMSEEFTGQAAPSAHCPGHT
jgi:hypothetical protein